MKKAQPILTVDLKNEEHIVVARQRARQIAELLGFDLQDQTRIATATSEIARNAVQYAGGGKMLMALQFEPTRCLQIAITDFGKGIPNLNEILEGHYSSQTGMGVGIIGSKRLMDDFLIDSSERGTQIVLKKNLPPSVGRRKEIDLSQITASLSVATPNPLAELTAQNHEILQALEEVRTQKGTLQQLNSELEDTNRGVVALYAELEEKAEYLHRASESKGRFFSSISHELRTPLNSIISLSHLLRDEIDGPLTGEQKKQVNYIERSAQDLIDLVNDLLDLSKLEAGKVTVKPSVFETKDVFSALRGSIRPMLGLKPVELIFEEIPADCTLNTDEAKVSQILRNFLSNALKFTDEGEIHVTADVRAERITFAVRDTGIGISPEDQQRIFDEWVQVDSPSQRRVQGTGLGLPLSRKLAEMLGGKIWLESSPGEGSTFYLEIPRIYGGAFQGEPHSISYESNKKGIPILVVEDDDVMIATYQAIFKGSPYEVVAAHDILEAQKALTERLPAAIILDVVLQHESAWPFLERVKKNPDTRDIPILVITVVDNRPKAMSLGADDFTLKPIRGEWLLQRLQLLLAGAKAGTLLIVDDEEVSRYVLRSMLNDTRLKVLEAENGEQAIRLIRENMPTAVVLDLMLPDMTGFDVLKTMRGDPRFAGIPVTVNTSKSLEPEEREYLERNATFILDKKNADRAQVVAAVNQMIKAAS